MILKLNVHDGNKTPVVETKDSHFTVETIIKSAKQNSAWKSISCSAGQDVPLILWSTIVYYQSACLYRAQMTIKTLYYPTDAQIYNS